MSLRKPNSLRHGFKAQAERIALDFREKLSLPLFSHLPAEALAEFLKVPFFPLSECGGADDLCCNGFSALTMYNFYGQRFIVYNHQHSSPRIQSDLMHELAHIICKHKPPVQYRDVVIPSDVRSFNKADEDEAEYLGGCLQIPRDALLEAHKRRLSKEQISEFFNASSEMVRYRTGITGVEKQVARWKW